MTIASDMDRIQVLRFQDRSILVVKPWLEKAYVDDMAAHGIEPVLGTDPIAIRSWLGTPRGDDHRKFSEDLRRLYDSSMLPGKPTSFLVELDRSIRTIIGL